MNVLILDDEVISVEYMKEAIDWQSCGISEILTAYNAEMAKEIILEHSDREIDLLLCDIEMPGEDGISFMQWVRGQGINSSCIFLTCHAKFEYVQEALRLRSEDYILKPAAIPVMEEKIRSVIQKRQEEENQQQAILFGERMLKNQREQIQEKYGEIRSHSQVAEETESFIQANLSNPDLSGGMVAAKLNLNQDYLGKIIKQETGITLNKLITQRRMEAAAQLIKSGEKNLTAVAEMVGYENYPYFSATFKKQFGCSPANYDN